MHIDNRAALFQFKIVYIVLILCLTCLTVYMLVLPREHLLICQKRYMVHIAQPLSIKFRSSENLLEIFTQKKQLFFCVQNVKQQGETF